MPFSCNLVLEITDWGEPQEAELPFQLYRSLRGIAFAMPSCLITVRVVRVADHVPPPPPAVAPPPSPEGARLRRIRDKIIAKRNARPKPRQPRGAGVPPATPKPRRWTADHNRRSKAVLSLLTPKPRKPRGAGVPPAAAQPPRICEHCGAPLHAKAPKKSRVCSKPECQKAKKRAAWHALPRERRIEIIRERHARILAKKEAAAPHEPPEPDDDPDSARDQAELDRLANLAKE